ncbi:MAG: EscU/YscU/HrcU family type III secretion system export apparatus switch protein [Gammaproteobacteria bacterium]
MAEESDLSRTEPASARRLQEAREAGDVPRSRELAGWLILLTALGVLGWQAPALAASLQATLTAALTHAAQPFAPAFVEAVVAVLWAALPVLVALFVAALVAPMLLSGWVYAPHLTQADPARVHPFKSLARLFSADGWFDAALTALKLVLVGLAVAWALTAGWAALDDLERHPGGAAGWVGQGVLALVAALAVAALLDAGWRWWRYLRRHAMTWREVLAEAREAELPAEVQAQLRARQQQAGQGANAESGARPHPNPPPEGEGANARPKTRPHPNPLPKGEGANVMPKAVNEVIG